MEPASVCSRNKSKWQFEKPLVRSGLFQEQRLAKANQIEGNYEVLYFWKMGESGDSAVPRHLLPLETELCAGHSVVGTGLISSIRRKKDAENYNEN